MNLEQSINKTKEMYKKHDRVNEEREVIEKFGTFFHPDNLDDLTKDKFRSFLLFENNKHWNWIHRQVNMITEDMDKLIKTLKNLLDESKPLKNRLDYLFPKNKPNLIKGLGRAVLTPILLVVYPEKYGVWNSITEDALKKLGEYPEFKRGATFSEKYIEVNKILIEYAYRYDISLFKLDSAWWLLSEGYGLSSEEEDPEQEEITASFELEKYFQKFLVDNWEKTPLDEKYEIYIKDGDILGDLFNTKEVGIIDILAKDRETNDWIVIELKKGKSSDAVVGQILRYINWVKKNKIEAEEEVKGIIIVNEVDKNLKNSLEALKGVLPIKCLTYDIKFTLNKYPF